MHLYSKRCILVSYVYFHNLLRSVFIKSFSENSLSLKIILLEIYANTVYCSVYCWMWVVVLCYEPHCYSKKELTSSFTNNIKVPNTWNNLCRSLNQKVCGVLLCNCYKNGDENKCIKYKKPYSANKNLFGKS